VGQIGLIEKQHATAGRIDICSGCSDNIQVIYVPTAVYARIASVIKEKLGDREGANDCEHVGALVRRPVRTWCHPL
jgi:hypothetical protein